jgi:hypothetical protein
MYWLLSFALLAASTVLADSVLIDNSATRSSVTASIASHAGNTNLHITDGNWYNIGVSNTENCTPFNDWALRTGVGDPFPDSAASSSLLLGGGSADAGQIGTVALGYGSGGSGAYSCAIGAFSLAWGVSNTTIGARSQTTVGTEEIIRIGAGTGGTSRTAYFWQWPILDKPTGLIPFDRMPAGVLTNGHTNVTFGSLTVLGGGNVVTNLSPGVLDPWHDVYTISTYTLGTVYISRANGEYQRLVPTNNVTICMDQPTFPAMGVPLLYLGVSNAAFTIALGTNTISTNSASQLPCGSSGVTFSNNWENAIILERAFGSTTTLWGVKQVR